MIACKIFCFHSLDLNLKKEIVCTEKYFKAENNDDLLVKLPEEYLYKQVEVIAFQVQDNTAETSDEKNDLDEAMKFFDSIHADMSNFKFNRDEANER